MATYTFPQEQDSPLENSFGLALNIHDNPFMNMFVSGERSIMEDILSSGSTIFGEKTPLTMALEEYAEHMENIDPNSVIGNELYHHEDGTMTAIYMVRQGSDVYCAVDRAPDAQNGVTVIKNDAVQPYIDGGQGVMDAVNFAITDAPDAVVPYTDVSFNGPYSVTMAPAGADVSEAFTRAQLGFGIKDNPALVVLETEGGVIEIDPSIEQSGYTFKNSEDPVVSMNLGAPEYTLMTTISSGPAHTLKIVYTNGADLRQQFEQCMMDAQFADINASPAPSLKGQLVDDVTVDQLLAQQCIDPADYNLDGAQAMLIEGMTGAQAVFSHAIYAPNAGESGTILMSDYMKVELKDGYFGIGTDGSVDVYSKGNSFEISKSIRNNDVEDHTIASCAGPEAVRIEDGVITSGGPVGTPVVYSSGIFNPSTPDTLGGNPYIPVLFTP